MMQVIDFMGPSLVGNATKSPQSANNNLSIVPKILLKTLLQQSIVHVEKGNHGIAIALISSLFLGHFLSTWRPINGIYYLTGAHIQITRIELCT